MSSNFIDFEDPKDLPIYRVMPMKRLVDLLSSHKLVLLKPSKWEDPFENQLLSSDIFIDNDKAAVEAKNSVYGQCWTLNEESDAMWRIYSHDKDGVRIKTTPRKLLEALKKTAKYPDITCFIGKVKYLPIKELGNELREIDLFESSGSGIANSLLYKRLEFLHENEVRLIYIGEDGKCNSDLYPFEIDPLELIEEITFDPRASENEIDQHTQTIRSKGYTGVVNISELYKSPKKLSISL